MRSAHENGAPPPERPASRQVSANSLNTHHHRSAALFPVPTLGELEAMALALEHIKQATGLDGIPSQAERRSLAAFVERYGHLVRPWWSEVAA